MTGATTNLQSTPAKAAEPQLRGSVLNAVAARFRPAGVFVAMLRADGSVAYHDPEAVLFFQRYVLPMLQENKGGAAIFRGAMHTVGATAATAESEGTVFNG